MAEPNWLEGFFLVSEADLVDPNFRRTVVLIIHHNEEGAFGLVLNRKLDLTLGDVVTEFQSAPSGRIPLFYGGPVQPQYVFCLHSGLPEELRSEHAAVPVQHVVFEPFVSGLARYLRDTWSTVAEGQRPPVHLYAGYSGWAAGQLESEIQRTSWVVRPAAAKYIFHDNPQEGWREALAELGGMHRIIAETGFKPSLN